VILESGTTVGKEGRAVRMVASSGSRSLRELADRMLEYQRVEYIHEDRLTLVATPGVTHRKIVARLNDAFNDAWYARRTSVRWELSIGDFQLERVDDPKRFFVPDIAIAYPDTRTSNEFREYLVMVVEVTPPKSPETVENDRGVKRKQYAKSGVPLYLLVDQENGDWHLYALMGAWPGYQVHSTGVFGQPIKLPGPFRFTIPTDQWPAYRPDEDDSE
jgi:Uma2 family endonuclease